MSFFTRIFRRGYGFYASLFAGGSAGYYITSENLGYVRQVVSKDALEISMDNGVPYVHVERKLQFLSLLPLRTLSRTFGYLADVKFPSFMLQPMLRSYVKMYDVDLNEAVDPELTNYKTLGSFFNRDIKPESRNFNAKTDLYSPCDGRVLALGKVSPGKLGNFHVDQVKGVSFSLTSFLGSEFATFKSKIEQGKPANLFFCTIYLAPGDFHGFLAPTNFEVTQRRHFSGRLFSVAPKIAEIIRPLFTLNERALYVGLWKHGFFSFTAVGATNVGNIDIDFDKEMKTNQFKYRKPFDERFFDTSVKFKPGDTLGRFRLGSTIVLIFEAPPSTQFVVEPGQRVLIGQPLTNLDAS